MTIKLNSTAYVPKNSTAAKVPLPLLGASRTPGTNGYLRSVGGLGVSPFATPDEALVYPMKQGALYRGAPTQSLQPDWIYSRIEFQGRIVGATAGVDHFVEFQAEDGTLTNDLDLVTLLDLAAESCFCPLELRVVGRQEPTGGGSVRTGFGTARGFFYGNIPAPQNANTYTSDMFISAGAGDFFAVTSGNVFVHTGPNGFLRVILRAPLDVIFDLPWEISTTLIVNPLPQAIDPTPGL